MGWRTHVSRIARSASWVGGMLAVCSCNEAGTSVVGHHGHDELVSVPFSSPAVSNQIDRAGSVLQTRGFVFETLTGRSFLAERGASTYVLSLKNDRCHVVLAGSSEALVQLDLELFSAEGNLLAESTLSDGHAAVYYCSPHPGVHYLVARARRGAGLVEVREFSGPLGLTVDLDDLFLARPDPALEIGRTADGS